MCHVLMYMCVIFNNWSIKLVDVYWHFKDVRDVSEAIAD